MSQTTPPETTPAATCGNTSCAKVRFGAGMGAALYYAGQADYTQALAHCLDAWRAAIELNDTERGAACMLLISECHARLGSTTPAGVARIPHKI